MNGVVENSNQRRNTRRRRRDLDTCRLPNPAIRFPKSRTEPRYHPHDIDGRFDVAVFSRRSGVPYPVATGSPMLVGLLSIPARC